MLGIIKGDIRYDYLHKLVNDSVLPNDLLDLHNIDELLLPIAGVNDDLSIRQTSINLEDILKQNSIKTIYTGNISNKLKNICQLYNVKLINFMSGNYIIENAKLTAKGIINYLSNSDTDISELNVLLVGYGNIGYYLSKILDIYEVNHHILTFNDLEKKYIRLDNKNIENNLNGINYDLIINTIPVNLEWDYENLKMTKIIDVASKPYGFDLDKIIENKINYYILSSIPSMYCPKTAATILKKCLNLH